MISFSVDIALLRYAFFLLCTNGLPAYDIQTFLVDISFHAYFRGAMGYNLE
jgi:hypothetical protein